MKLKNIAIMAIIISLSLAVVWQQVIIATFEKQQPYMSSDMKAIDLAFTAFKKETRSTSEDVRHRFPVVIRFGNVRCVALMIPRNTLGRTPVYCFDMDYNVVQAIDTRTPEVVDTRPESRWPQFSQ